MAKRRKALLRKFILIVVLVNVVCVTGLCLQRKKPPKPQRVNTMQKTAAAKMPKAQKIPKPGIDIEAVGALPDSAKKNGYDAIEIWERSRTRNISPLGKDEARNIPGTKTVFLTFDDGPSTTNTPQILDILKKHDVKATFCILGSQVNSDRTKELLKREFAEGHAIANHTYSHEYSYLYPGRSLNLENFKADLKKTDDVFKEVIGPKFSTRVVRCPGGMMSWKNMEPLKEYLKANNMASIDWNALTGDTEGKRKNAQELLEYMKKELAPYITKSVDASGNEVEELPGLVVLLMHDTYGKEETVKALPSVIEYFKDHGFEFKILV